MKKLFIITVGLLLFGCHSESKQPEKSELDQIFQEAERKAKNPLAEKISESMAMGEDSYKNSCEKIAYKKLKRDADILLKKDIKARGQVAHVLRSSTGYEIQLYTGEYGDNQIYVLAGPEVDVYEKDLVTVYGFVTGPLTYTSQAGWNITVPSMYAVYIEH